MFQLFVSNGGNTIEQLYIPGKTSLTNKCGANGVYSNMSQLYFTCYVKVMAPIRIATTFSAFDNNIYDLPHSMSCVRRETSNTIILYGTIYI